MQIDLDKIKAEVFARRPILKKIFDDFGNLSLGEYVKKGWQNGQEVDEVFLETVFEVAVNLLGKDRAEKIRLQLQKQSLVSTIDHHGLLNHPVFLNSSLIYSLRFQNDQSAVVFSTESVSLNNSCWAGCFLQHQKNGNLNRYSFFPDKIKMSTVFAAPKISPTHLEKFAHKSNNQFEEIITKLDFTKGQNFSEQASFLSSQLWRLTFPSAPQVVHLPLETIVNNYIIKIAGDSNHPLTKIIFTPNGKKLWQKYFGHEHTFMFWGVGKKGYRVIKNDLAKDIINQLKNRQAYASSPLCFMVLLYAGLACVGGCNQTTWLTNIAKNFVDLLTELEPKNFELIEKIKNIPTENFAECALASLKVGEKVVQPSGIDLIQSGKDYYLKYQEQSNKVTLAAALDIAMPELYTFIVPPHERL